MRLIILLLFAAIFSSRAIAGHVGCVTINDRSLCETEDRFSYNSEVTQWQMSKDEFKTKITNWLDQLIPNHNARVASVFLWVNDFNSFSALRVQVWSAERSFILDVPTDINAVSGLDDILVRGTGLLPYPVDFGYSLGEILVSCSSECGDEHKAWLKALGFADAKTILPKVLIVMVPKFNEVKSIELLKTKSDFSTLFNSIELSPILEGNGFRDLAFTMYF